jgi:peroxiredoxin
MRNILPAFLALILFGLLVYIGIEQDKGLHKSQSSLIGKPLPDIKLKTFEGKEVSLKEFHGKVVLINFWATWRPPCREEFVLFKKLYEKYKDRGFIILAINTDPENLAEFLKEYQLPFPVLIANDEVMEIFPLQGLPTSFLVNREGIIVKERKGIYRELEKDLEEIL